MAQFPAATQQDASARKTSHARKESPGWMSCSLVPTKCKMAISVSVSPEQQLPTPGIEPRPEAWEVLMMPLWPSGLMRWPQAPLRKGVGPNPTTIIAEREREGGSLPSDERRRVSLLNGFRLRKIAFSAPASHKPPMFLTRARLPCCGTGHVVQPGGSCSRCGFEIRPGKGKKLVRPKGC